MDKDKVPEKASTKIELDLSDPNQIEALKNLLGLSQKVDRDDILPPGWRYITQINAGGKTYFCDNIGEEGIFHENNPDMKIEETFRLSMPDAIADRHLDEPGNRKQFIRKEK